MLNACSPAPTPARDGAPSPSTLLGDVSINAIERIVISSAKKQIVIEKRGTEWMVGDPYGFPVHMPLLMQFLIDLEEAELGQRIHVSPKDYPRLNLQDPVAGGGNYDSIATKVELFSGSTNALLSIVLGSFDFPDDQEMLQVFGEKASARRFIRFINSDKGVYLSPSPLYLARTSGDFWVIRRCYPTNGIQKVAGISNGKECWSVYRNTLFDALHTSGLGEGYAPTMALLDAMNNFMASGLFAGIAPLGREDELMEREPRLELRITSFDGRIHHIAVGKWMESVNYADPAEHLSEGSISLVSEKRKGNAGAYALRIRNEIPEGLENGRELVETFKDRVIILDREDVDPFLELFRSSIQAENKHKGDV